jgi:alanine racemase
MVVVKDDAYGHGLQPIVRRAVDRGARWFGAFDVGTGTAVRAAVGSSARVFAWMIGGADDIHQALDADLDLGIGDADLIHEVAKTARRRGAPARVHLKVDSGLHRNGIRPEFWDAAVDALDRYRREGILLPVGVWSHLSEASDTEDDWSRTVFEDALARVSSAGWRPLRHLAASAAAWARADFRYDMVRVGAFCYGIRPEGGPTEVDLGLTPIATLTAQVSDVTPSGVVIDIGGTDGLPARSAGWPILTDAGTRRILRVDIGTTLVEHWPGARPGETVTVFGDPRTGAGSITSLAETAGTIGEEIAVRLSPRVERIYRDGSDGLKQP